MNDLTLFNFGDSKVRTIVDDNNKPWFAAVDVARILGYKRTRDAIQKHCRGQKKVSALAAAKHGGKNLQTSIKATVKVRPPYSGCNDVLEDVELKHNALVIPESDVYMLAMRSNLPGAEPFQRWVTEEVLPEIRRTGGYKFQATEVLNGRRPEDLPRLPLVAIAPKRRVRAAKDRLYAAGMVGFSGGITRKGELFGEEDPYSGEIAWREDILEVLKRNS